MGRRDIANDWYDLLNFGTDELPPNTVVVEPSGIGRAEIRYIRVLVQYVLVRDGARVYANVSGQC